MDLHRTDVLLDGLGSRRPGAVPAGDELAAALASWARDVDAGAPVSRSDLRRAARRGRRLRRALGGGAIAVATLTGSSVAAALTGTDIPALTDVGRLVVAWVPGTEGPLPGAGMPQVGAGADDQEPAASGPASVPSTGRTGGTGDAAAEASASAAARGPVAHEETGPQERPPSLSAVTGGAPAPLGTTGRPEAVPDHVAVGGDGVDAVTLTVGKGVGHGVGLEVPGAAAGRPAQAAVPATPRAGQGVATPATPAEPATPARPGTRDTPGLSQGESEPAAVAAAGPPRGVGQGPSLPPPAAERARDALDTPAPHGGPPGGTGPTEQGPAAVGGLPLGPPAEVGAGADDRAPGAPAVDPGRSGSTARPAPPVDAPAGAPVQGSQADRAPQADESLSRAPAPLPPLLGPAQPSRLPEVPVPPAPLAVPALPEVPAGAVPGATEVPAGAVLPTAPGPRP